MKKLWASFFLASLFSFYSCSNSNEPKNEKVKIAIIIDDMGRDPRITDKIAQIDPDLTLSFLPYVSRLEEQTAQAHENGNEIMLHMPMETHGHRWRNEPDMLQRNMNDAELQALFLDALSRSSYFSGVNNHLGSAFTEYRHGMNAILQALHEHYPDYYFIDSRTSERTIGEHVAKQNDVPSETNDLFIDNQQSVEYTLHQLFELEMRAGKKGHAIAIGHPHPTTIAALEYWVEHYLDTTAYDLVRASELVHIP